MRPPLSYRQIADDLHSQIRAGLHPPASTIPSYSRLAGIYGVSVSTAQRAVALLRDRGAVTGYQGRGVYVEPAPGSDAAQSMPDAERP